MHNPCFLHASIIKSQECKARVHQTNALKKGVSDLPKLCTIQLGLALFVDGSRLRAAHVLDAAGNIHI